MASFQLTQPHGEREPTIVSKIILLIICKAYIQEGACLKQIAHVLQNNVLSDSV